MRICCPTLDAVQLISSHLSVDPNLKHYDDPIQNIISRIENSPSSQLMIGLDAQTRVGERLLPDEDPNLNGDFAEKEYRQIFEPVKPVCSHAICMTNKLPLRALSLNNKMKLLLVTTIFATNRDRLIILVLVLVC